MPQRRTRPFFPTALRTIRRSRTLTQGQFAQLLEVSHQTYARYESGETMPPHELQARISAILGTPVHILWPERLLRPRPVVTTALVAPEREVG